MIPDFMSEKLIISFEEYLNTVEKLALEINNNFKPTVLVGIMRGAAPIIDILSRILLRRNWYFEQCARQDSNLRYYAPEL